MDIKNIIIGILVVAVALTSIAFAYKDTENTEIPIINPKEDATIKVSGESLIKVEPDIAYVYVEIKTDGNTAEEAKKKNNEISRKVIESLEFMYTNNIETDSFDIRERYDWEATSVRNYVATNILKVSTKDSWAGKIIDKAVESGATEIIGIEYELSEDRKKEIKNDAIKKASENAYGKALAIADGLDKELGDLISVEESNFYYEPHFAEVASIESSTRTDIFPRKLEVTANVVLIYEIK